MLSGVLKSGSPMEKEIMFIPSAFRLLTMLAILTVPDSGTLAMRLATIGADIAHGVY